LVAKAPNVAEFPGDFAERPPKVAAHLHITSRFNEFHCTGYYVEAGSTVTVTVLEGRFDGFKREEL